MTDQEFKDQLHAHLPTVDGAKPILPLHLNPDGSINREKTLQEPCFRNFTPKEN